MTPTTTPVSNITKGFWLAGAFNVFGILLFSKVFTNTLMMSVDPAIFSWPGLVAILLWGLAYASVGRVYLAVPYLVLVFFVEKMLYGVTWMIWLSKNGSTLPSLFAESPLTATFYAVYGGGDILFGLFFLWAGMQGLQHSSKK